MIPVYKYRRHLFSRSFVIYICDKMFMHMQTTKRRVATCLQMQYAQSSDICIIRLNVVSTIFIHLSMAVSYNDMELNEHIYSAASLKYHIKLTATYVLHAAPFLTL